MKELFEKSKCLSDLGAYIKSHQSVIEKELTKHDKALTFREKSPNQHEKAKIIQKVWRGRKIKQAFVKNAYLGYVSMIPREDEQNLLSSIMFGRHEAELPPLAKDRLKNPYIHESAFYHRVDYLTGPLFKSLLKRFNVPADLHNTHHIFPITDLKTTPLEPIIRAEFPDISSIKILREKDASIVLLAIPKSLLFMTVTNIFYNLFSRGLTASPWEVSIAAEKTQVPFQPLPSQPITLDPNLPKTIEDLHKSNLFKKLNRIANSPRHATRHLAKSLIQLLQDVPKLSEEAIQRIALMIDLSNTFYEHHYPKFAFSVYAILHEISLGLVKDTSPEELEKRYSEFLEESKTTFLESFNLSQERLTQSTIVSAPAMSGTNAHAIAMRVAEQMQVKGHAKPTIRAYKPTYYEFDHQTPSMWGSNPDIFVISGGPIVNPEGLTPGMDINLFVKHQIIDKKRKTPATLIIDATTTLYKNLKLEPEVAALVEQGQLSILVFESHQKFGLLHTDQAQYGRMFGICSKNSFTDDVLKSMMNDSREDFNRHVDQRIGAFISNKCRSILEDIKTQHFTNGALLRNILSEVSLVDKKIITHEDMLQNLNELYFLSSTRVSRLSRAYRNTVAPRNSFGHYATTISPVVGQHRVSPDASDDIDCLIQTAQIYLAHHYSQSELQDMLIENASQLESLSLEHQIMSLALLNQVSTTLYMNNPYSMRCYAAIESVLNHCPLLKNRQAYLHCRGARAFYREQIILNHKYPPMQRENPPTTTKSLFNTIQAVYEMKLKLSDRAILELEDNRLLLAFVLKHKQNMSMIKFSAADALIKCFPNNHEEYMHLTENEAISKAIIKIYTTHQEILTTLRSNPQKHAKALIHAPIYLASCYEALKTFASYEKPTESDKHELLSQLNAAKECYSIEVLSQDRSKASKAVRILLKLAVNFIVGVLTLGIAHGIHRHLTGSATFFGRTRSDSKLRTSHHELSKDLQKIEVASNEKIPEHPSKKHQ